MTEEAWQTVYTCCLGIRSAGDLIAETDEKGEPIVGDTILLLNAHHETISFTMPALKEGQQCERLLQTTEGSVTPAPVEGQQPYTLPGRSMAVLRTTRLPDDAREPRMTGARLESLGAMPPQSCSGEE
jgi:isoamylase